jgi:hypothetical protein
MKTYTGIIAAGVALACVLPLSASGQEGGGSSASRGMGVSPRCFGEQRQYHLGCILRNWASWRNAAGRCPRVAARS